jgi:signal transduction histidine kinase
MGNLSARLPMFSLPELSRISHKFNAMAETLQNSISNNHRLSQQLIRLQEDERKHLAHDLHDEIGQHLTAINIDAGAILKANNLNSAHAKCHGDYPNCNPNDADCARNVTSIKASIFRGNGLKSSFV